MKQGLLSVVFVLFVTGATCQQSPRKDNPARPSSQNVDAQKFPTELQKTYMDESHCLASPEIRSEKDNPISCYCRDRIAEARYVYFNYVSVASPKHDNNFSGVFLTLQKSAEGECGQNITERLDMNFIGKIQDATTVKDWKWTGPEVVRTYPPDDVIKRIKPSGEHSSGRWVPFTVQLIFRGAQDRVIRTEEYSSREFIPVITGKP